MCFYFSVHVKAAVNLVVIYWNALLTTPSLKKKKKKSRMEDADVLSCPVLGSGLGPGFPGRPFRSLELPMLLGLISCSDWFYRLVDTCCWFTLSRNDTHTLCLLFGTSFLPCRFSP